MKNLSSVRLFLFLLCATLAAEGAPLLLDTPTDYQVIQRSGEKGGAVQVEGRLPEGPAVALTIRRGSMQASGGSCSIWQRGRRSSLPTLRLRVAVGTGWR